MLCSGTGYRKCEVDGNQLLHFRKLLHISTGLGKEQGDCADACDFFDSYSDSIASWLEDFFFPKKQSMECCIPSTLS